MTAVHPIVSSWGRFGLFSFFVDAPEPAIVDTGIATTPADAMAPAIAALGRRIEDVRWILLTHGHVDHVGGARALWELTGRRAQVVIHEADAPMVRHTDHPDVAAEMEPTLLVTGGETLSLGGGVTVSVHSVPGHTAGSVAYEVDGEGAVFVGDAVQIHGAANGFPGYADPVAYRHSLLHLRDTVRPRHLYLGHPYRGAGGGAHGVHLHQRQALKALQESLDLEARVAAAAKHSAEPSDSPYSPFATAAEELGYRGDPTLEPRPFFTTMNGYVRSSRG